MTITTEIISKQLDGRYHLINVMPGIQQVIAPFFHADGDPIEVYVRDSFNSPETIAFSDCGMTMTRLAYVMDTSKKSIIEQVKSIAKQQQIKYVDGELILEAPIESFINYLGYFAQSISKIMAIAAISKDYARSVFYEQFNNFIFAQLERYKPKRSYAPLPDQDMYMADIMLSSKDNQRQLFLYPVRDNRKALDVVSSLLFFITKNIKFQSLVVCEQFDELSNREQRRIMNAADKCYYTDDDFYNEHQEYLKRNLGA